MKYKNLILIVGVIIILKKFRFDEKYLKISLYAFGVLAALLLFSKILDSLNNITITTAVVFGATKKLILPFLIGFFIAYLLNPCVIFLERFCFNHIPLLRKKITYRRAVSIFITYLIVLGGLVWLAIYFIPEITASFTTFSSQLPKYMESLEKTINVFFMNVSFVDGADVNALIENILKPLIIQTKNAPLVLQAILDSTVIAASTILNVIMGIFIGFYMLMDKEKFGLNIRKIIYALFSERHADRFLKNVMRIHGVFQSFIIGKTIDSTIIGIICFIGMSLIKAPYVTIISLIIGITNMIPYFGPFIGAIPAILITLLIDPSKSIWVGLFILALQQFDGIILGPKILGDSTGLSPIWIILSIIVGGALLGPLGMFLGVPIFASISMFFAEYIDRKYNKKYSDVE